VSHGTCSYVCMYMHVLQTVLYYSYTYDMIFIT